MILDILIKKIFSNANYPPSKKHSIHVLGECMTQNGGSKSRKINIQIIKKEIDKAKYKQHFYQNKI